MLAYYQLDSWEQIPAKFGSEFYQFHSRKYISNCPLPKWRPFCPGGWNNWWNSDLRGLPSGRPSLRLLLGWPGRIGRTHTRHRDSVVQFLGGLASNWTSGAQTLGPIATKSKNILWEKSILCRKNICRVKNVCEEKCLSIMIPASFRSLCMLMRLVC